MHQNNKYEWLSFRAKDPAQSGSGIHKIIEKIALHSEEDIDEELAEMNVERDKGSLYRYGDDQYGEELTRSYLQRIEEDIKKKYIPAYLNS